MLVNMSMVVPYKPSSSLTITEAPFRVAIDLVCTCMVTITYMIVKRMLRPVKKRVIPKRRWPDGNSRVVTVGVAECFPTCS